MKKTLFALLLCVCLVLTACKAADPDNLFEMPEGSDAGVESSKTDPTESESVSSNAEEVILYTGTYPYGNMQKNIPPGDFVLCGNEVVFSQTPNGKSLLYCYDLITEEVRLYCENATCEHNDCVAAVLQTNLQAYNGDLYGLALTEEQIEKDEKIAIDIVCVPIVVRESTTEIITSADVNSFIYHEDKLYIRTADASLVVLEEGQKEPEMLIEEYNGISQVIFGNYLYAATFNSFLRVNLVAEEPQEEVIVPNGSGIADGQHIYYVDNKTYYLYRCDMDGCNTELIVEQPVLLTSINFDDDYFYYRLYTDHKLFGNLDCCDLYRFPKKDLTQVEKIATLPTDAYQIFTVPGTGKIFVTAYQSAGGVKSIYVMNADGSDMQLLQIP